MKQIERVAIVGGTHGNELIGVSLIKKFKQYPNLVQYSSFETLTVLGNPQAIAAEKRYIDKDLNRCFLEKDLKNPLLTSYEEQRAKELNNILGPKGNPSTDFILDIHSTTANMGITIIPSSFHPFNLKLAAYLEAMNPLVKVYSWPETSNAESSFLRSVSEFGCTIELGPVAHGVLSATLFQKAEHIINAILGYLDAYNRGQALAIPSKLTLFQGIEHIDYLRTQEGELQGMIHPQLQYKDYALLKNGDLMFLTFDGQAIAYEGQSTVYPVFINEAAYYEKSIAMCLTQKQLLELSMDS
jgi:aspartoacylase